VELDAETSRMIERVKTARRLTPDERVPVSIGGGENDEAPDAWEESEGFALGSISASWWARLDSNQGPIDYESTALTN
jgi:hypothetical protein